jgi:hypothetical protein
LEQDNSWGDDVRHIWGTQVAAYHVAGGWWDSREEALIVQRRRQSLLVIGEHFSQVLYLLVHGE